MAIGFAIGNANRGGNGERGAEAPEMARRVAGRHDQLVCSGGEVAGLDRHAHAVPTALLQHPSVESYLHVGSS